MTATDEFNLICEFLGALNPEIEAREAKALEAGEQRILEKIAQGESSDSERNDALDLLLDNSTALEFLAAQLSAG